MIKTLFLLFAIATLTPAQLTFSGESHYSFSRSNLFSDTKNSDNPYPHDNALVSNIISEEWLGWSLSAGYLLNKSISFHLTCSPAYSIASPRNNTILLSRWGSSYEKVIQSVDYIVPVYVSIKYHLETKSIKPFFGILSGLSIEKTSYETTILLNDLPPQTLKEDEFNRYFLLGADIGANWYFSRHVGIIAGFIPELLMKNEYLKFTGLFHIGIFYLL